MRSWSTRECKLKTQLYIIQTQLHGNIFKNWDNKWCGRWSGRNLHSAGWGAPGERECVHGCDQERRVVTEQTERIGRRAHTPAAEEVCLCVQGRHVTVTAALLTAKQLPSPPRTLSKELCYLHTGQPHATTWINLPANAEEWSADQILLP